MIFPLNVTLGLTNKSMQLANAQVYILSRLSDTVAPDPETSESCRTRSHVLPGEECRPVKTVRLSIHVGNYGLNFNLSLNDLLVN